VFADEMILSFEPSPARRARLVLAGKADWVETQQGQSLPVPLAWRPQLHATPRPVVTYLVFDVNRPPFDDVRARRAVNYALDRQRLAAFTGGSGAARPSCQVLPPSFPGYRVYCPYTLEAKPASGWTAPDRRKAMRLIAASRTAGGRLQFWWPTFFGERSGRYVAHVLESLGYRVRLRLFADATTYYTGLQTRGAAWQVAANTWLADFPAASNFIGLLSCRHQFNLGHFCNRRIDREISRALRIQERDPVSASRSWAALDRELTDLAPWAVLYTPYIQNFVSKRVGNFQNHPIWGTLFGQLWVR
jgi:peptide/nickel transport system substrate-binding protein